MFLCPSIRINIPGRDLELLLLPFFLPASWHPRIVVSWLLIQDIGIDRTASFCVKCQRWALPLAPVCLLHLLLFCRGHGNWPSIHHPTRLFAQALLCEFPAGSCPAAHWCLPHLFIDWTREKSRVLGYWNNIGEIEVVGDSGWSVIIPSNEAEP